MFSASISRGWHEIVSSMTARLSTALYLGVSIIISTWIPLNLGTVTSFGFSLLIGGMIVISIVAVVDLAIHHRPNRSLFRWTYAVLAVSFLYFTSKYSTEPELSEWIRDRQLIISVWGVSVGVIDIVASRYNWAPWRLGLFVLYGMMSFSFTQFIDKQPMAAAYPLICATTICIEVLVRTRRAETEDKNRFTVPLSVLGFSVISSGTMLVQWSHQPDFFYPTFSILTATMACLFSLFILKRNHPITDEIQDFLLFQAYQTLVLFGLVCRRIYALIEQESFGTAVTSKLWIMLNHPNALGVYFAACCFLAMAIRPGRSGRLIQLGWISLSGFMLILTFSRTGWLSLLVVITVGMSRSCEKRLDGANRHCVYPGLLLTSIAGIALLIGAIVVTWYRVTDLSAIRDRLEIWRIAVSGFSDAPFLGHGFHTHSLAVSGVTNYWSHDYTFIRNWLVWDRLGQHFHNLILEIAWTFGVSGLIVFVIALFEMMRGINSNRCRADSQNRFIGRALAVMLVSGFFDFTLYYPAVCLVTAVMFASIAEPMHSRHRTPIRRLRGMNGRRIEISSIIPLLGIVGLICLVCFPVLGEHWLARGDRKKSEDPAWTYSAYQKAMYYRPWHRQSVVKGIRCLQERDLVNETSSLVQVASAARPDWLEYRAIDAWIGRDAARRVAAFQSILSSDPHGFMGRFFHVDLAFSKLLLDPEQPVEDLLTESIQYDPSVVTGILRNFTLRPGEFVIRGETLRQFLTERYGKYDFRLGEMKEIGVPLDSILTNLEKRLLDDRVGGVEERRRRLIRARWARLDYIEALRLSRRWKIRFDSSDVVSVDVHRVLEAYAADNPEYMVVQGEAALTKGDFQNAEKHFLEAIGRGVESARVLHGIGTVRMHQNRFSEALEYLNRAAEREPEKTDLKVKIGICHFNLGRYSQAIEYLERSLRDRPFDIDTLRYLGIASYLTGDFDRSEVFLKFVLEVVSDDPESAGWRVLNRLSQSPHDESIREEACRFREQNLFEEGVSRELIARLSEVSCR